jgi:glycosyltransferase involved in cell wall biosynthesis
MSTVPKLLFVSPVFPDITGYGLAMRAGAILEGLSASCQVYLLIIPIHDPNRTALSPRIRPWCRQYCVIRVSKLCNRLVRLGSMLQSLSIQSSRPLEWRYASVRMIGLYTQARREQQAADMYANLERELLPRFDGIYVCSQQDKDQLNTQVGGQNIHVLPNVIRLPSGPHPVKSAGPFTFLFVGNLSYYPNEDAVVYFLEHVLPCLRQRAKQPFCLTVIGSGQSRRLRRYRRIPEYRYMGYVGEMAPYYAQADAVVVPLRAGGGTRIKVLEAFSFQRPVVSTTLGVEGLEVDTEKHILIADHPQHFAEQCCRLMEDKQLSVSLTTNALTCLVAHYTQEALQRTLSRIMSGNSRGAARCRPGPS